MKRNLITIVFTTTLMTAFGQARQIDLLALIQKFVPDSVKSNQLGEWAEAKKIIDNITWTRFYCDAISCLSDGELTLSPKKGFNENNPVSCNLMISGPKSGYNQVDISIRAYFEGDIKNAKNILLGAAAHTGILSNYCTMDKNGFSYATYKISMTGKVPFWITFIQSFIANSGNPIFDINLYLVKYTGPTNKCK